MNHERRHTLAWLLMVALAPGCMEDGVDDEDDQDHDHDHDDGHEDEDDHEDEDCTDGETEDGGPTTGVVEGISGRRVSADLDGDGIGTLYVAAFTECALTAPVAGLAAVPMADASAVDTPIPFEIPDLPPGVIFLAAFLDDDGSADPMMPAVSPGDLVFADVTGDGILSCVEVEIEAGESTQAEIWLNATVPR